MTGTLERMADKIKLEKNKKQTCAYFFTQDKLENLCALYKGKFCVCF